MKGRVRERVERALEWLVILMMASLVLDVVWQVATRFILQHPSSWTDELATLLIIWVALLGSSVAFVRHGHLGVDVLVNRLPPRKRMAAEAFVYLCIAFFAAAILIWGGSRLVYLTLITKQVSPALGVKMGHVYLALPISGVFILFFSTAALFERLQARRLPAKEER